VAKERLGDDLRARHQPAALDGLPNRLDPVLPNFRQCLDGAAEFGEKAPLLRDLDGVGRPLRLP
jgi:hypothetical protein